MVSNDHDSPFVSHFSFPVCLWCLGRRRPSSNRLLRSLRIVINGMNGVNRLTGTNSVDLRVEVAEGANACFRRYECVSMDSIDIVPAFIVAIVGDGSETNHSSVPFAMVRVVFHPVLGVLSTHEREETPPSVSSFVPVDRTDLLSEWIGCFPCGGRSMS